MVNIVGLSETKISYSVLYTKATDTLIISSVIMNDDAIPYRESDRCLVWLDSSNVLCELECIFPIYYSDIIQLPHLSNTNHEFAPIIDIRFESKDVYLFIRNRHMILVMAEITPTDKITIGELVVYMSGMQIVALECKSVTLIE